MSGANSEWQEAFYSEISPVSDFRAVTVKGRDLLIIRHGDQYIAIDRWCPHQNADMATGKIIGNALKCPLHGFVFSLTHGRGLNCPGFNVKVHEVEVRDGYCRVRLK